ncbi:hypothetical protein [Streptomyces chartreusis]|uniref:hypothetical protein n=1 Tax=Streptomyces chartreusis TaxID=1969 RepID=UPI0036613AAD
MDTERGYGPDDVALLRYGSVLDPDPGADRPRPHAYVVGDYGPENHETFSEGFHVLHNPCDRTPIADGVFRSFTEHRLRDDGLVLSTTSRADFFTSHTVAFHLPNARRSPGPPQHLVLSREDRSPARPGRTSAG